MVGEAIGNRTYILGIGRILQVDDPGARRLEVANGLHGPTRIDLLSAKFRSQDDKLGGDRPDSGEHGRTKRVALRVNSLGGWIYVRRVDSRRASGLGGGDYLPVVALS